MLQKCSKKVSEMLQKSGRGCDQFATVLLSDAPAYVVDVSGQRVKVHHGFNETQVSPCFATLRRIFAVLSLIGMVIWFAVDYKLPDAGGLVSGIQNSYTIDANLPQDTPKPGNSTTTICTCTYNSTNTYTPQPPYATLKMKHFLGCPDDLLQLCSSSEFNATELLQQGSRTEAALYGILARVCLQILDLEMPSPTTAVQLELVPWKNARYNDITSEWRIKDAGSWGMTEIKVLPQAANLTEDMMHKYLTGVLYLETSIWIILRALTGMEVKDAVFFNDVHGKRVNLTCPGLLKNTSEMPFSLIEMCAVNDDPHGAVNICPDAYAAYQRWCAPAFCNVISQKNAYRKTAEILSALGGVYGIVTLCLFAIFWRLCVCLETRRDKSMAAFSRHWARGANAVRAVSRAAASNLFSRVHLTQNKTATPSANHVHSLNIQAPAAFGKLHTASARIQQPVVDSSLTLDQNVVACVVQQHGEGMDGQAIV